MSAGRPDLTGNRPRRTARHSRADRQSHPPDPRRAQLQHGAALGRCAFARRRAAHVARAGTTHAGAAVGPRRRRLVGVSVRRAADAHARRDQRGRAGHAGLRAASLRPGMAQWRGPARGRLHKRHAGAAWRDDRARPAGQSDGLARRKAERRDPVRHAWRRDRSSASTTRSIRPGSSCASSIAWVSRASSTRAVAFRTIPTTTRSSRHSTRATSSRCASPTTCSRSGQSRSSRTSRAGRRS